VSIDDLDRRLQKVEQNLEIFAAGEAARDKWMEKVDNALFGKNGEPGIVDIVRELDFFRQRFVKVLIWVTVLVIAPLFGSMGFLTVKILANIDQIIKLLDKLQ
jgi:hypothetical protein